MTAVRWKPADEPPAIEPGELVAVIVARRSTKGKWYVFGACYLNQYSLDDCSEDEPAQEWTGFHCDYKHPDYSDYYEPIDVEFWAEMPLPPTPGGTPS
jgi:hypothetical protein